MKKEQIESLIAYCYDTQGAFKDCLMEWFEQNPIEPKVVGLSDEQIKDLHLRKFPHLLLSDFVYDVEEWLKTQTFTVPEVKEVVVGLSNSQVVKLHQAICLSPPERMPKAIIEEFLKAQTFEVKEVAVGLSDEQMEDLCFQIANVTQNTHWNITGFIENWFKAQTFIRPDYTSGGWKGKYDSLKVDYSELEKLYVEAAKMLGVQKTEMEELKASKFQLFEPDWGIIPSYVDTVELVLNYFNCGECKFLHSYDRPKPLAPSVEICTRWKHKESGVVYFVDCIGKQWVSENNWVESVTYRKTDIGPADFFTKPIDDFLAKFNRVGDSE